MQTVPFKQTTKSGCGSITIANLFNEPRFMEGIESLECGESIYMLNKKLAGITDGFYIDVLMCTPIGLEIQNRVLEEKVFTIKTEEAGADILEHFFRAYFVVIKNPYLSHAILVLQNFKNGKYYVVDGRADKIVPISLTTLINNYHITLVATFNHDSEPVADKQEVFFDKRHATHLFNPGE